MALPAADVELVQRWCDAQVPLEQQDRERVTCEVGALHLTVHQEHPSFGGLSNWVVTPVARLRWTASRAEWSLHCLGGDLRFRPYRLSRPAKTVVPLLRAIERDETFIFWG